VNDLHKVATRGNVVAGSWTRDLLTTEWHKQWSSWITCCSCCCCCSGGSGCLLLHQTRRSLNQFLHISSVLQLLGTVPERYVLTGIVEEHSFITGPHDTPSNSKQHQWHSCQQTVYLTHVQTETWYYSRLADQLVRISAHIGYIISRWFQIGTCTLGAEHTKILTTLHFNGHFSKWTWVSRYQIVSILDFIGAKDDKTCKAPLKSSSSTNQHRVCFTGRMPFMSPNQQCQSIEGKQTTNTNKKYYKFFNLAFVEVIFSTL